MPILQSLQIFVYSRLGRSRAFFTANPSAWQTPHSWGRLWSLFMFALDLFIIVESKMIIDKLKKCLIQFFMWTYTRTKVQELTTRINWWEEYSTFTKCVVTQNYKNEENILLHSYSIYIYKNRTARMKRTFYFIHANIWFHSGSVYVYKNKYKNEMEYNKHV